LVKESMSERIKMICIDDPIIRKLSKIPNTFLLFPSMIFEGIL